MKVALVYDRVNKFGGAERVLEVLHEIFPEAPLYTAVYHKETAPWADSFDVRTTFLQNIPYAQTNHEYFAWLAPLAFEGLDLSEFDVVISITSEYAKGVITKPGTLHICYCLTPTRYLWSGYDDYFKAVWFRTITKPLVSYLRTWDQVAAQRPDYYIAISKTVQQRIKQYYGRESIIIYPPVILSASAGCLPDVANDARQPLNVNRNLRPSSLSERRPPKLSSNTVAQAGSAFSSFASGQPPIAQKNTYFLLVSRLVPYKRVDIAIEAFNKLRLPLKIVGTGRDYERLKRMAGPSIEFVQNLTDDALSRYYQDCTAFVFPGQEDFGLAILEAQAFGKPVIAFGGGGALETVIAGKTGEFFSAQTVPALIAKLKSFNARGYDPRQCMRQAEKFSKEKFKKEFMKTII